MKNIDWVSMLSKLFYKISFQNMEKFDVENPIFDGGVKFDPPLVLKGLSCLAIAWHEITHSRSWKEFIFILVVNGKVGL